MVLKLTRGKRVFTTFMGLINVVGWGSLLAASKIYNDPLPSLFGDAFCLYMIYAGTDVALMGIKNEGELPITDFVLKNLKNIPHYFSELRYSTKKGFNPDLGILHLRLIPKYENLSRQFSTPGLTLSLGVNFQ